MKIWIIENTSGKQYFVRDKEEFCKLFNLTRRLLDYTVKGASKNRYQPFHKGFKIVEKIDVVEDPYGDIEIFGSDMRCKRLIATEHKPKIDVGINLNTKDIEDENRYLTKELKSMVKQNQRLRDKLNLFRKLNREDNRFSNLSEEFNSVFKEIIGESKSEIVFVSKKTDSSKSMVICLSDWHIGQLVSTNNNYFDLDVAYKRVDRLLEEIEHILSTENVDTITIAMLGDFIHAQSITTKPDMKLSAEFGEVRASVECVKLICYMLEMLKYFEIPIQLAGVIGNESRFSNHLLPSNLSSEAKNNLDYLIYQGLKLRYSGDVNIKFLNEGDDVHYVLNIKDKNILCLHGYDINHKTLSNSLMNKAVIVNGGNIDYSIFGHIHSTYISDDFARNASLVGANAYSEALNIPKSYVSQNVLLVGEDIKAIPIRCEEWDYE